MNFKIKNMNVKKGMKVAFVMFTVIGILTILLPTYIVSLFTDAF